MNTEHVKDLVRHPYAWPGGYERVAITYDGAVLCGECVRNNIRECLDSTRKEINDGWYIIAITYEAAPLDCTDEEHCDYCDHCSKEFGELSCWY